MSILPSDFQVPGQYAKLTLAVGSSGGATNRRDTVYIMPKLSASPWVANTLYRVKSVTEARTGAGEGSPLALALQAHLAANKMDPVYALPVDLSGTAADGYVALSGTATGPGIARVTIGDVPVAVSYRTGDTAAAVATKLETACDALTNSPVTASSLSGTLTLTVKVAGAGGNDLNLEFESTLGSGITGVVTAFANGAASNETTAITSALEAIENVRKYYVVIGSTDATNIASLGTHINAKNEPVPGLRSIGIAANIGAVADAEAQAALMDNSLLHLVYQNGNKTWIPKLLGTFVGNVSLIENTNPATNLTGKKFPGIAACNITDRLGTDDLNDLLNAGVTVINSDDSGAYCVSFRTTDPNVKHRIKVSVTHAWIDQLLAKIGSQYGNGSGWNVKADELLDDGTIDSEQEIPAMTVVPSMIARRVVQQIRSYVAEGKLKDADSSVASVVCEISEANPSRIDCAVELFVVDPFEQFAADVFEASAF